MDVLEAKKLVCESGRRLLREKLVAGTWGNISCRVDDKYMVVTPSGASYETMKPEDVVLVELETVKAADEGKPSSETPIHAAVYRNFPDVQAVVHTHSLYASVLAAANQPVKPYIGDTAMILGPDVRIAPAAMSGSDELRDGVVEALQDRYAALMKNHGAICVGRDMEEAFTACHLLEKSCQIQVFTELLGGGDPIPREHAEEYRNRYLNVYQKK